MQRRSSIVVSSLFVLIASAELFRSTRFEFCHLCSWNHRTFSDAVKLRNRVSAELETVGYI